MFATVLCIEDDVDLRADIAEELVEAGYQVLEAGDGREGLATILAHRPDLVVSDISMPGLNGYELLQVLRDEHPQLADMPFVFLSALADREHQIEGFKLGADDYLTKPVDFDMLLARVETRLRQTRRMLHKKEADAARLVEAIECTAEDCVAMSGDLVWK